MAACGGNVDFKSFSSTEGGFTVKVPVLPTESTTQADTAVGKVLEHDFVSQYDDVTYSVVYMELPDEIEAELNRNPNDLAIIAGSMVSHVKGRLLGVRGVATRAIHSTAGREIAVSLPDGKKNYVGRLYWSHQMLYQVQVILPKVPSYRQDLYSTRFLESFMIDPR